MGFELKIYMLPDASLVATAVCDCLLSTEDAADSSLKVQAGPVQATEQVADRQFRLTI